MFNSRFFRFFGYIYILALPICLNALEVQPWFGDVYECHFLGSYSYSRFRKVQGALPQLTSPFNVNIIYGDFECTFTRNWSFDADIELADTTKQTFGVRSGAIQLRHLFLDDIIGDPISMAFGGSARVTTKKALRDISCPSHGNVDFELNLSVGREFDSGDEWRFRLWGFGALGIANRGSPWLRGIIGGEGNYCDHHKWGVYLIGSHGYGRKRTLDPNHFYGYGRIRQKSIDIGFRYGYGMGCFGTLRFEYIRRVSAKVYPQQVNTVVVSYLLPFSF